ncbi:sacsin N-terminal ATP-binding-like domain-containing protein [Gimesia sp.]|uniref:sacsin N-terminal ATP-binding-like domain-containing protein n=1 Tax=Gimesia sp. TaxID=2024833 RepID=UPI003A9060B9
MSTDSGEIQNLLRELSGKRQRWVDVNEENEFSEGINNLLTELYPENAHFIYELLQNAEDVEASNVSFKLQSDQLVVEHDGKRRFTFKDIKSITSIGTSTKKDDPTAIGKFGVGFKAVFAYTNTPEIHSGDHHFCIHDLVVPDTTNVKRINVGEKTQFVFPFDHPNKKPNLAVEEIRRGLLELPDITLLFLKHISEIEFVLPDGSKGSLHRKSDSDPIIEIQSKRPHDPDLGTSVTHNNKHLITKTNWLRFTEKVEIADPDKDNRLKECDISIAFNLERKKKHSKDKKNSSTQISNSIWEITPLENGNVSIYFPAIKEISRLRFHINAPFASTVARDSVRECKVNKDLRDHLADLLAKSMTDIRDLGLLTPDFLGNLPLRNDDLSPFYDPIRKRLIHEFNNWPLVPIMSGDFKRASRLCIGPDAITSRIGDNELAFLSDYEYLRWVERPSQNNSRAANFLKSLDIYEWDFIDLKMAARTDTGSEKKWLESKSDEWICDLYSSLNDYSRHHAARTAAESFPIIRIKSKRHMLIDTKRIYLSVGDQFSSHFEVIDPKVIKSSEADVKGEVNSFSFTNSDDFGIQLP